MIFFGCEKGIFVSCFEKAEELYQFCLSNGETKKLILDICKRRSRLATRRSHTRYAKVRERGGCGLRCIATGQWCSRRPRGFLCLLQNRSCIGNGSGSRISWRSFADFRRSTRSRGMVGANTCGIGSKREHSFLLSLQSLHRALVYRTRRAFHTAA